MKAIEMVISTIQYWHNNIETIIPRKHFQFAHLDVNSTYIFWINIAQQRLLAYRSVDRATIISNTTRNIPLRSIQFTNSHRCAVMSVLLSTPTIVPWKNHDRSAVPCSTVANSSWNLSTRMTDRAGWVRSDYTLLPHPLHSTPARSCSLCKHPEKGSSLDALIIGSPMCTDV